MCRPPENTPADSETETDTPSEDERDNIQYLRAKWMFDGAKTLDEVIQKLNEHIEYIEQLKRDGWELIDKVSDDYGPMVQKTAVQ